MEYKQTAMVSIEITIIKKPDNVSPEKERVRYEDKRYEKGAKLAPVTKENPKYRKDTAPAIVIKYAINGEIIAKKAETAKKSSGSNKFIKGNHTLIKNFMSS